MRLFLLVFFLSAPAFTATLDEFNEEAKQLLSLHSDADDEASRVLHRKMVDGWGLSDESFESNVKPLSQANYVIEVDADCSQYAEGLQDDKAYEALVRKQLKATAKFLADYHSRLLGNNVSIFSIAEVRICTDPIDWSTSQLKYDRFKSELWVRIGPRLHTARVLPSLRNNLTFLDAETIRSYWDQGVQWKAEDFSISDLIYRRKNPLTAYWPYLNPIGEVRTALREIVRKEGLLRYLKLEKQSDKALAPNVVEAWKELLSSPQSSDEMITASLAALGEMSQEADVERTQVGLVNVENFHQIGVALGVSLTGGNVRSYQQHVQVPEKLKIRVKQYGLVNVSTTDQVHLTAAMLIAPGTFEKATYEQAKTDARQ